ncbi:MAG: polymerase sigma factor RpoE [Labilithrix sp.]|nr:polymerase sigma factor RpoE [Labilithrix sp.]
MLVAAALGLTDSPAVVARARPSLGEVFSTHVHFVWRSLAQLGVGTADLEDLIQEVFLVAHRRYASWDGEHVRYWLFAIARRCAAAYRRRGHRRHELTFDTVPETPIHSDPSGRLDAQRLDRALLRIDESKRTVFILFEVEQLSMREVAEALGCPVQTAYSRLHAARRELARLLFGEP